MIFKYRFRLLGGHVHVRVFAGENPGALGLTGTLTFRAEEWDTWKKWLTLADTTMVVTRAALAAGLDVQHHFIDDTDVNLTSAVAMVLDIPSSAQADFDDRHH